MNRREALQLLARSGGSLAGLGSLASFMNGCASLRPPEPMMTPDRFGVMILADGWRADSFQEMLEAGALPNIQEHLVDRGTMVENCVGTFPSTSGPAHLAFINGRMPGTNNCPGLRWVDRKKSVVRDYCTLETVFFNKDLPPENYTIYEMLARYRTVCIFDFVSRGATEFHRPSIETLWFTSQDSLEDWKKIDREAVSVFRKVFGEKPLPAFTFVWMPAIDHLSHLHGLKSLQVEEQAEIVDQQVGRIIETLREKGVYDKTLITLSADHGLRKTETNWDIRRPLEKNGFKVLRDLAGNDEFDALYAYNAVRAVSGNGCALIYLARKKKRRWATWIAWEDEPTFEDLKAFPLMDGGTVDVIQVLRDEPAVKFTMAMERDGAAGRTYRVFTKDGDGRIERHRRTKGLKYAVLDGPDPLGYSGHAASRALMDGDFHDKDRWFEATTGTDYPDALYQITQLFDAERCGEIVTSSAPGFDFLNQRHVATHGGLEKEEIMVPCVVAGPGIRKGERIPRARTVDVFPMYLEHFGVPNLDGVVPNVFKE